MDPLWDIEICTPTQLECIRRSSQNKPCSCQDGDKWGGLLIRRLDCTGNTSLTIVHCKAITVTVSWTLEFVIHCFLIIVSSLSQCYEGKPLFEFDRSRMFRSGIVGFSLHGSLSHYYYQLCEVNLIVICGCFHFCTYILWQKAEMLLCFPGSISIWRLVGSSR